MQLDNTRIAVRERSLLDTFDLALRVVRHEVLPVTISFLAGALPMLVVNDLMVGWMIDLRDPEGFFYVDDGSLITRFVWSATVLTLVEVPIASALSTAYLGQVMFVERPKWKTLVRDVAALLPRLIWCQLLVRGTVAVWLLLMLVPRDSEFDPLIEFLGLGAVAMYTTALRFWRPFLTEIIMLERNPLISREPNAMTISRRSSQLHGPSAGDLFLRGVGGTSVAVMLTLAVFGTFIFGSGVFLNDWHPGPWMVRFVYPASLWIVAGYLTVVRFLNYLDLRIRHEGWEVELLMRAEGERLGQRR